MRWRCRLMSLHLNAFFFAYPVEPNGCVVHSKYCGKREHQCGDDAVYVKTGTKPFTQNAYFLEGHLSALHSRLAKVSWIFRKLFKSQLNHCVAKWFTVLKRSNQITFRELFDSERHFKAHIGNHLIQNGTSKSPPGIKVIQQRQGCIDQRGKIPPIPPTNRTPIICSIYNAFLYFLYK